jgi:hypothetical protein
MLRPEWVAEAAPRDQAEIRCSRNEPARLRAFDLPKMTAEKEIYVKSALA